MRQCLALMVAVCAGAAAVAAEGLVATPTGEVSSAWTPKTFLGKEFFLLTNWYSWSLFDADVPADLPVYRACGRGYSGKLPKNAGECRPAGSKRLGEKVPEKDRQTAPYRLKDFFEAGGPLSGEKVYAARDLERPIMLRLGGMRNPFFLDKEYPLADKADYATWKKAHPNCLGLYALGEYDGEVNNYLRGFDQLDDALVARQRKDFPAFLADRCKDRYFADKWVPELVRRASEFGFGETNVWGVTSWYPGMSMLLAAAGANPGYEASGVQANGLWTLGAAYTRGAARQFGRPWFWYTANYATLSTRDGQLTNGENNYRLDPRKSWTATTGVGRGVSESLTARLNLYGYLSGALFVEPENFHVCHSREIAPKKFEPTQEARDFNRLHLLSQKLDRGIPLTPLALVLPAHERLSVEGYPDNYDTFGPSAAVVTLVPGANRRKEGIEGGLYNSRFGEIWDIVCPELQKADEAARSLSAYRCAVLQGVYRNGLSAKALETYVRNGGTLVLGCDQVRRGTVSAALTGVDFPLGASAVSSGAWFADEAGKRYALTMPYVWEAGKPTTAKPLWKDEKGSVVVYANAVGKGRVVTVTAQVMLPYGLDLPGVLDNEGAFIRTFERVRRGEIPCELMAALFDRIQDETLPVRVEGDIQYGVNRTKKGYLVWLINNKGVTHFMGEKATVDPKAKPAQVKVRLRNLRVKSVKDGETGGDISFGHTATVSVQPGEWQLVDIEELRAGEKLKCEISCDRKNATYVCGEKATFAVKFTDAANDRPAAFGKVRLEADSFGPAVYHTEDHDLATDGATFKVTCGRDTPGLMRLKVFINDAKRPEIWCVAFEPEKMKAGVDNVPDFDEFWRQARAKYAREVPLDVKLEADAENSTADYEYFNLSFNAPDGTRRYGFISFPRDKSHPWPARVEVPSSGVCFTGLPASRKDRQIHMMINVFPFDLPRPRDDKKANSLLWHYQHDLETKYGVGFYCASGIGTSREDYAIYPTILALDRISDWLWSRPETDRTKFAYWGASQGGGFGTMLLGLNHHFTKGAVLVPNFTDQFGAYDRQDSDPHILDNQPDDAHRTVARRNWPYFAAENFARRITCPTLVSVGYADPTCPAHGGWIIHNLIPAKEKHIAVAVGWPHCPPCQIWNGAADWIHDVPGWKRTFGTYLETLISTSERKENRK